MRLTVVLVLAQALLISHLGASSAAVALPEVVNDALPQGALFESARVHPDGRPSADNHASRLGWAFELMDRQGRLFPDYEAEWTESFAVAPGVDERDAVLGDAASSLRDLVRSGAYSAASSSGPFLPAGLRLSRVERQRRMVDISQQLARAHADGSSPLYRLHASAAHLRNGSVIREALGALLEHGEELWAPDPSLPPQHAVRLGVMRDTAHAFSGWFRQKLAVPESGIGAGGANEAAVGAGASDQSGVGGGDFENSADGHFADEQEADDEDPAGAAAFIELRRLLFPPAPHPLQRHSRQPTSRHGHGSSGLGLHGSLAIPHKHAAVARSGHAAVTLGLPPGVGISGVTVTRLTQSQVVERSGRQLVSLLLETQSTAVALLEAGVGTQEIFACVVDNIMNMAPEIILQLIINAVRDPIIQLLGVLLAQITPDLLVPNLGQVPINVNPKGTLAKKSPAPPPCVCKGDDGSAYDPSEGVTGGASFLQLGEGVLLWRPTQAQVAAEGLHSGSGDAAWRAYPNDEGQAAAAAETYEAHGNSRLGGSGSPQATLPGGVSVPPAAAALMQSMQELLAREGPGFGVHTAGDSGDADGAIESGLQHKRAPGRRPDTSDAALLEARTSAGSGGGRAPLHRVSHRGASGGASGEDAPAAGGAASTSRSVVATLQAASAAGRMMEVAPWCPCRPGHLGYSFVLLEVGAQGQASDATSRGTEASGTAAPGTVTDASSGQHSASDSAAAAGGDTIANKPAAASETAVAAQHAEPASGDECEAVHSDGGAAEAHSRHDTPVSFSPATTLAFLEAELMRTLPATLREHVGAALASPPASRQLHGGMHAAAAVHDPGHEAAALHEGSHHAATTLPADVHEAGEAALLESLLGSVDAAAAEAGMAAGVEGTAAARGSAGRGGRTRAGGADHGVEGSSKQRSFDVRFAAGGAAAQHRAGAGTASAGGARAKTQMQIAAEQEARQGAEANALNAAMAWVHESAYASANTYGGTGAGAGNGGKGGPIGKMEPRIREEVDAGMASIALPRVYALVAERLKTRLARTVPAAAHRAISREMIQGITRRLTVSLYRRLMAAVARPLVLRTATRLTAVLTPALARPISLALTQSLTHHPAADYFCEYCRIGGVLPPLNATIDFTGAPLAEQAEGQRQGAYCAACARANAHDRLQDEHVTSLVNRYARTYAKLAVAKVPELARRVLDPAPAATPAPAAGGKAKKA
jgi:hypothetical protein